MCSYQSLYHDENCGYVIKCNQCENLQIVFGNMMITVHLSEFATFRRWLKQIEAEKQEQDATLKTIMIPTPCEGVKLLLTLHELFHFNQMLDIADTEIKSREMIRLFNIAS